MRRFIEAIAPRNASLGLFGAAVLLLIAAVALSILPAPPGKANTGAPIWAAWAVLVALLGLALRSGKRALWIAVAVIAIPTVLVNLPYDVSAVTWVDTVANILASLVALAAVFGFTSALIALWRGRRRTRRTVSAN